MFFWFLNITPILYVTGSFYSRNHRFSHISKQPWQELRKLNQSRLVKLTRYTGSGGVIPLPFQGERGVDTQQTLYQGKQNSCTTCWVLAGSSWGFQSRNWNQTKSNDTKEQTAEVEGQQKAKYKDEHPYLHDLEQRTRQMYLFYNSVAIQGVTLEVLCPVGI